MTDPVAPVAIIMAGGSGTRFWPASRAQTPKQLTRILGDTTMIQAAVARVQPLIPASRILVVTTRALAEATRRQLPMLDPAHIIAEPVGRDTAAAVALAGLVARARFPGAVSVLLPADQVIAPADAFQDALRAGIAAAAAGALVVYGIAPRHAATGYGYVQLGDALPGSHGCQRHRVARFVEKPDAATAEGYLRHGGYRWNSGIFTWRAEVALAGLERHCPWLIAGLAEVAAALGADGSGLGSAGFASALDAAYGPLRRISVDYALMEHAERIEAITGAFAWDDLGAWDSLYDHLPADADGMRIAGEAIAVGCRDSLLVRHGGPFIAAAGLDGITVVSTPDAVLVLPRGRGQEVKRIVERLHAEGRDALL